MLVARSSGNSPNSAGLQLGANIGGIECVTFVTTSGTMHNPTFPPSVLTGVLGAPISGSIIALHTPRGEGGIAEYACQGMARAL